MCMHKGSFTEIEDITDRHEVGHLGRLCKPPSCECWVYGLREANRNGLVLLRDRCAPKITWNENTWKDLLVKILPWVSQPRDEEGGDLETQKHIQ